MKTERLMRRMFVCAFLTVCLAVGCVNADESLLLDYKFDEGPSDKVLDWGWYEHYGTLHGTKYVAGKFGKALAFDGKDDYVECAPTKRLDATAQGTIALWVYPEAHQGGIFSRSTGASFNDLRLVFAFNTYKPDKTSLGFFWSDERPLYYSRIETELPPLRTWTHYALTWDRNVVRMYRDGALAGKQRALKNPAFAGVPLKLGWCQGLGKAHFKGKLDEVRVYSRALSADEIKNVFAGVPVSSAQALAAKRAEDRKWLNSFVKEIVNTSVADQNPLHTFAFTNDRIPDGGWVFVATTARTGEGGKVTVHVDSGDAEPIVVHEAKTESTLESMRFLSRGEHKLIVLSSGGAQLDRVVVRSIPEILYANFGRTPHVNGYGEYDWAFLKKHVLPHTTTIISGRETPSKIDEWMPYLKEWKAMGRRWIAEVGVPQKENPDEAFAYWAGCVGMQHPMLDGIIADEFGTMHMGKYVPAYAGAFKRLRKEFPDKVFMPYGVSVWSKVELYRPFIELIKEVGYAHTPEVYIRCPPTAEKAKWRIEEINFGRMLYNWRELVDIGPEMQVIVLGLMSEPPETLVEHPQADFKVFMDMEFHYIANEGRFRGLRGIFDYLSTYASEETLRWLGMLFRHYCIEGKRARLSTDPYVLPHIVNGDFDDGTAGWEVRVAEKDGITTTHIEDLGWIEGRYPKTTQGNNFCLMRRSEKGPNRISQSIKAIEPGRLYSFRMFSADPKNLKEKQKLGISIDLEGCDVLPEKSFQHIFRSHCHGTKELPRNKIWLNYHVIVFRARTKDATLVISDWLDDKTPGAAVGQETIFNFVQVRPYLAE